MGGPIHEVVQAAPVSDKFDAVVHGRAAHAGAHPEDGINAIAIAAKGIARMRLGRIDEETTANIGIIRGGDAVNVVPDRVSMRGESRSHSVAKLDAQIAAMRQALQDAVDAHPGAGLEICVQRSYQAYRLDENAPVLRRVAAALARYGGGRACPQGDRRRERRQRFQRARHRCRAGQHGHEQCAYQSRVHCRRRHGALCRIGAARASVGGMI